MKLDRIIEWIVLIAVVSGVAFIVVNTLTPPIILTDTGNYSQGVFSSGIFSSGIFSTGVFSVGVFSVGIFSVGIFSLGLFSTGLWVIGFYAFGKWRMQYPRGGDRADRKAPPESTPPTPMA